MRERTDVPRPACEPSGSATGESGRQTVTWRCVRHRIDVPRSPGLRRPPRPSAPGARRLPRREIALRRRDLADARGSGSSGGMMTERTTAEIGVASDDARAGVCVWKVRRRCCESGTVVHDAPRRHPKAMRTRGRCRPVARLRRSFTKDLLRPRSCPSCLTSSGLAPCDVRYSTSSARVLRAPSRRAFRDSTEFAEVGLATVLRE